MKGTKLFAPQVFSSFSQFCCCSLLVKYYNLVDMMTHAFSLSECAQDRGTNAAFGHDFLKHLPDCCRRQHELVFRIRVTLIENFASRGISRMYNSKESTGFVGLQNLGATCYLNSLLQMLFHINSFRKAVYLLPPGDAGSIVFELQNLFRNLQTSSTEVNTMVSNDLGRL